MRTFRTKLKATSDLDSASRTPARPVKHPGGGRFSLPARNPLGIPALAILASLLLSGCTILATRPVQLMNDTATALRAAKEVQADSLAPELYRQSYESFLKARNEYRFKNFELARRYAIQSRRLAEQAEFEALRNGAQRKSVDDAISDPLAGSDNLNLRSETPDPTPAPYDYPTPQPTIYGSPSSSSSGSPSPPSSAQ